MTAANTPHGEISPARGAMILDCLARVLRTGRVKKAPVAEQGADGKLVKTVTIGNHDFYKEV